MVYDIFNFLTGYIRVKIDCYNVERLLNSGLSFWNVKRCGYNSVYANVSLVTYRRLIRDNSIGVTLIYERGLLYIFKSILSNKAMLFSLIICVLGWIFASQMILGIRVEDYHGLKEEEVKGYIAEYGITPFTMKSSVNLDELKNYLISKDRIAWASVGFDGTVLNVQVVEQVNKNDNTPCDIIASRRAVIKKIDVYSGIRNKEINDTVEKGEMLVAGIYSDENGVKRIQARATIVGTVWEEGEYTVDTGGIVIHNTGNTITESYIDFWGTKSYIEKAENSFAHYTVTEQRQAIGGRYGIIPVSYVTRTYNEVEFTSDNDVNDITHKAKTMAFDDAVSRIPQESKIVSVTDSYEMSEGHITAKVLVEYETDIGVLVPTE